MTKGYFKTYLWDDKQTIKWYELIVNPQAALLRRYSNASDKNFFNRCKMFTLTTTVDFID